MTLGEVSGLGNRKDNQEEPNGKSITLSLFQLSWSTLLGKKVLNGIDHPRCLSFSPKRIMRKRLTDEVVEEAYVLLGLRHTDLWERKEAEMTEEKKKDINVSKRSLATIIARYWRILERADLKKDLVFKGLCLLSSAPWPS